MLRAYNVAVKFRYYLDDDAGNSLNASRDVDGDFLRDGQQKDVVRKLRKSVPAERDRLDLHGFTIATALPELERFIRSRQSKQGQAVVLPEASPC
jgi:DNA-nicking Smr family endonuclease